MSRFELAFATWVVRFRWPIIVVSLVVVALAASGLTRLTLTNNYRVYFSPDNPELLAFTALENTFIKNDTVLFVVTPANGTVFSAGSLALLEDLTARAWQIPYSNRVDSLTNFQHTEGSDDELVVRDLVTDAAALDAAAIDRIEAIALAEPLLRDALVASDGAVAGVNVTVQLPGLDETAEMPAVVAHARALADAIEHDYPGSRVRLTGVLPMDYAFTDATQRDLRTLVPASFVIVMVLIAVLVGGFSGTFGTLLVIGFSIMVAMGLAGYVGYPISTATAAAPVIILTVGVANCVHILETFRQGLAAGLDRESAVIGSVQANLAPIFLASLTTVIGFLTFNFSEVPPFRQLGNLVAFGDIASYLLAVTFLPALLAVLPARAVRRRDLPVIQSVAELVIRRHRAVLWGVGAVALLLVANLPRNELNDVFVNYFDHSVAFRTDTEYTTEHLTGVYHVHYALAAGEAGGISDPDFMREVDAFAAWFRAQPETIHVASYTDIMKRLNRNLHGDDPAFHRLPDDRELAAQYLLLYEMSLPYGLDLNNQINVDKSSVRVSVATETLSSKQLMGLNGRALAWLEANAPTVTASDGTGTAMMFAALGKRNIIAMLTGTVFALVLVSAILLVMFRSLRLGLISLVPNLLPSAAGFGLWGLLVGQIGLSLSVVASMTLGIIIDDTVHYLTKYRRARRTLGLASPDAVRYAFRSVGRAMAVTTAALVAGFLVLGFSHFELNSGMGLLTAIVIALALACDLLFLPALLLALEEKSDEGKTGADPVRRAAAA